VRIVYDVSPLSHPLTGVGNYVRGSLAGLVEAAAGEHEIVAFAPTSPAGRKAIPRALEGVDVELRLVPLPFSQRWRDAWSRLGRPSLERFLGEVDVFHYSDWMYPPQAGGVRATTVHDLVPLRFPQWVTPAVLRYRPVCNPRAAAERLATLSPAMRDVCHSPKQSEMARPNIADARITNRAVYN